MRAWVIEKHGGPEVLQCRDIAEPVTLPGNATVRVEAVGLNHLDLWVRKGVPGHVFPLPIIPGCDIAGVLESATPELQAGTRVLINPVISCGTCPACQKGREPLCKKFGIIGETQDGGCAERVSVPAHNLVSIPKTLSFVDAAALPIAFVTAWHMLKQKAQLQAGEWILIHGAGSGVSVAAIQMAKYLGAKIITTSSDEEKLQKAKVLGADYTINYSKNKFRAEIKKILEPFGLRGVDVVVDHVGKDTFEESMKCLNWGGRLVTCGATTGDQVALFLKPLFFKNLSVLGSTMGSKQDLQTVLDLVNLKKIKPVIDTVFSFDQVPMAFQKIEDRKVFGKVVIQLKN